MHNQIPNAKYIYIYIDLMGNWSSICWSDFAYFAIRVFFSLDMLLKQSVHIIHAFAYSDIVFKNVLKKAEICRWKRRICGLALEQQLCLISVICIVISLGKFTYKITKNCKIKKKLLIVNNLYVYKHSYILSCYIVHVVSHRRQPVPSWALLYASI